MSRLERAEDEPQESEEQYRAIFELAGVGAAQADPATGRLLRVNPKMCEITGYSEEELLGMTFPEITHPDDREEDFEGFRRMMRGETPAHSIEKRYVRKDGRVVWTSVNATVTRDEAGRPLRTVAVIQDITDRKRTEEELRRSEERFRSLVQNASDIITVVDAEGTIRYVSPAVKRVLGYRPEEMIGKSAFDFLHPDDLEEALGIFAEVSSEPGVHPPFEFRVPHKDGSWRYLELVVNNLLDDPSVRGVVVNQRDITERKRAEEEIEAQARQQAAVAELGRRALEETDPFVLMDEAVALVARTLQVEYCKVLELLPDGDALLLRAGVGWEEGLIGRAMEGTDLDSQAGYTLR